MVDRRAGGHTRAPAPRWAVLCVSGGAALVALALVATVVIALAWPADDPGYTTTPYLPESALLSGAASSAAAPVSGSPSTPASASPSTPASAAPAPSHGGTARPAPPPPRGDWPTAATTGVPAGVTLRSVGDVTVTKNGTVVQGLSVHGQITVKANNVVIKNVRVTNSEKQNWGIVQQEGYGGLTVQDSDIRGNGSQEMQQGILNLGGGLTVRRTDISGISDGIASDEGLFEDNYLHDPRPFSGDHVDMVQSTGSAPNGKTLVIRHNRIINTEDQTSAVGLFQDFGVPHDVLVENNYLAGGGYTVYGGDDGKGTPTNIRVRNNTFGRDVFPKGGTWGPVAHWADHGAGNTWSGNVWADTGAPVTV